MGQGGNNLCDGQDAESETKMLGIRKEKHRFPDEEVRQLAMIGLKGRSRSRKNGKR